jgi:thiamine-monophosphate kinase
MLALSGGEDYQFLFTFPGNKLETIEDMQTKGSPVSIVGEVVKGRGVKLFEKGKERMLNTKGYEHFGVHP